MTGKSFTAQLEDIERLTKEALEYVQRQSISDVLVGAQTTQIGVNAFLWRASLETLNFMPMAQVDSTGGVIITDWYANPEVPEERVKVTVYILDQALRADGLRVAAVRQQNNGGTWTDVPVRAGTVQKLEETILGRARDLRRAQIG